MMMEKKLEIDILLGNIQKIKELSVSNLLEVIKTTNDPDVLKEAGFILVDHFKDEGVELVLKELIKDPKWKNRNGIIVFFLSESTNNPKYLYFLIDMIIKNDEDKNGVVFMDAYHMILNLHPPFNGKDITKSLQRLRREIKKTNNTSFRKRMLNSLTSFLETQRELIKFYKEFNVIYTPD